jgi:serine/threonine protein phosphatase Stp1
MRGRSFRFRDASASHPGRVRTVNEDAFIARPADGVWAVADGMGGHINGQWASSAIVDAINDAEFDGDFDSDTSALTEAVYAANAAICAEGQSLGRSMGSTVVALFIREGQFAVFWAGDSRVYLLRGGLLHGLTTDHSQVREMVAAGRLTPEEAEQHPMSHVLSRAVGVAPELHLDAVTDEAQVGDIFLLCSDGLNRTVPDAELAALLANNPPSVAVEQMVALALERGAPDNVTVVVVGCEATTLLAPA